MASKTKAQLEADCKALALAANDLEQELAEAQAREAQLRTHIDSLESALAADAQRLKLHEQRAELDVLAALVDHVVYRHAGVE